MKNTNKNKIYKYIHTNNKHKQEREQTHRNKLSKKCKSVAEKKKNEKVLESHTLRHLHTQRSRRGAETPSRGGGGKKSMQTTTHRWTKPPGCGMHLIDGLHDIQWTGHVALPSRTARCCCCYVAPVLASPPWEPSGPRGHSWRAPPWRSPHSRISVLGSRSGSNGGDHSGAGPNRATCDSLISTKQ